jgi:RNase H-fold protein (predicted Holliday junction resolvase)
MKKKIFFAATMLLFLSTKKLSAQNQSDAPVAPSISIPSIANEVFRFKQGLVTHLLNGNLPTSGGVGFTGNDRWITQGEVNVPTQTLYGTRTQINGRGLVMGYSLSNITGDLSDPIIQWGGSAGFGVAPGDLRFRSFLNPITTGSAAEHLILRANGTSYFGRSLTPGNFNNPWVEVENNNENNVVSNTGINAIARNLLPSIPNGSSTGVYGFANALGFTFGGPFGFSSGSAVGVIGEADAGFAIGVLGSSLPGSVFGTGVYGITSPFSGNAGFFDGDVFTTGMYNSSDIKLKKNFEKPENILQKINKLNPLNYEYKIDEIKYLNLPGGKQNGFIAQELEEVFPELVKEIKKPKDVKKMSEGLETFKAVNYVGLIPILTKAIQELNEKVETLEATLLEKGKNEVFVVNEKLTTEEAKQMVGKSYVLAQNTPNPFNSSTSIKYSIPQNKTASIAVFDLNGKMLLQYNELRGNSQVTINGSTLQAGMYLYSLLVNGEEIITKKMILTK